MIRSINKMTQMPCIKKEMHCIADRCPAFRFAAGTDMQDNIIQLAVADYMDQAGNIIDYKDKDGNVINMIPRPEPEEFTKKTDTVDGEIEEQDPQAFDEAMKKYVHECNVFASVWDPTNHPKTKGFKVDQKFYDPDRTIPIAIIYKAHTDETRNGYCGLAGIPVGAETAVVRFEEA